MTSSALMGAVVGGREVGGLLRQAQPVGEGDCSSVCVLVLRSRVFSSGGIAARWRSVGKRCVGRAVGGRRRGAGIDASFDVAAREIPPCETTGLGRTAGTRQGPLNFGPSQQGR